MEIQRDVSSIFEKDKIITVNTNSSESRMISGFRSGIEIYQPPLNFINAISSYTHEVGHVLGDKMSFQSGLKLGDEKNILSFDDIASQKISISFDEKELSYVRRHVFNKRQLHIRNEVLSISQKLLKTLFIDKFQKNEVNLHNISYRNLNKLVADKGSGTTTANTENGLTKITLVNSKYGRNSELPSIVNEAACLLILENTLIKYNIMPDTKYITMTKRGSPSHQRAQNIVAKAHASTGWRIPSMVDINSK